MPELKLVFTIKHADLLPQVLERESVTTTRPTLASRRKSSTGLLNYPREQYSYEYRIVEVLYASLGDSVSKTRYLFLRTEDGDVVLYEPFINEEEDSGVKFCKINSLPITRSLASILQSDTEELVKKRVTSRVPVLFPLVEQGGYDTVFLVDGDKKNVDNEGKIPESEAYFIIKTAKSVPKAIPFAGGPGVKFVSPFRSLTVDYGFIYVSRNVSSNLYL